MPTIRDPLAEAVSGSGRTKDFHTGAINRVDVHVYFVQPGGEAKIVASLDGTNFAPYAGIAPMGASQAIGLDIATATYLAVEYTNVTELKVMVGNYSVTSNK